MNAKKDDKEQYQLVKIDFWRLYMDGLLPKIKEHHILNPFKTIRNVDRKDI